MTTYHLDTFLSGHVFGFILLLTRIGAVMTLFPGIGEPYVAVRTRLTFAAMISLLLLEPMMPKLPEMPPNPAEMARLIFYELAIGLFFGTLIRMMVSTLEAAGSIIGLETGLSNATIMNPAQAVQSPLPAAFLSTAGLVLIFITGLDHFIIRSAIGLYDAFPAGGTLMPGDMAQMAIKTANRTFVVGIELAAPFFIMSLLLYSGFGILQRLMPQVQVFMVLMPLEIWGGLFIFSLTAGTILMLWLKFFDQSLGSFFQD